MIGAGPHNRQAQRHVDPFVKVERLQRYQGLIVVHAQRRIIGRPGARGKQSIGWVRAAGIDPLSLKRSNGWRDECRILMPHAAIFPRMGVQRRNRQPGAFKAIILHQRARHDPGLAQDQVSADHAGYRSQGNVNGQRHGPQRGPGQHHHGIVSRNPTGGGHKLGLSGVGKAHFGQQRLGDRRRDHAPTVAIAGQFGRFAQRCQRQFGTRAAGCSRCVIAIGASQNGQDELEAFQGFGRVEHFADRD